MADLRQDRLTIYQSARNLVIIPRPGVFGYEGIESKLITITITI
jgi:hypothetical protein